MRRKKSSQKTVKTGEKKIRSQKRSWMKQERVVMEGKIREGMKE